MNSKKPESPNIDILIAPAHPKWNPRPIAGLQVLEAPALAKFNWLVHGFSTRLGGASELITTRGGQDKRRGLHRRGEFWRFPELPGLCRAKAGASQVDFDSLGPKSIESEL